jgi:hypothetical protein
MTTKQEVEEVLVIVRQVYKDAAEGKPISGEKELRESINDNKLTDYIMDCLKGM